MRPKCLRSTSLFAAASLLLGFLVSAGCSFGRAQGSQATSAPSSPVPNRLTQAVDEKVMVSLRGTVHPLANARNDRGAIDGRAQLNRIQVMLKRSPAQEVALQQAIREMHTPGAASYHKWLTPNDFGKQYGPSDADLATLSNWLGVHGFTVTRVNPGRQTLEMTGSAAQFESTFHAAIHKYQVNGRTHTSNAAEPQIPAALAPVFGGFASLNNFPLQMHSHKLGTATYDTATHVSKPNWTVGSNTMGYSFPLAPADFAVQYDLNPLYNSGIKGAGQTIAIINESNVDPVLVAQYRTLFGLPASPLNVILDGNDPGIDGINNPDGPNGASGEAYLDVEISGSVAPQAQVDLVIAADTALANGLGLAAEHAVYGNVAPVLSISFGLCEQSQGASGAFWNQLWEQAAAQGQTVLVSSGDSGSAGCDNPNSEQYSVKGLGVNGIASTPYNIAVGGTDFYYSDYAIGNSDNYAGIFAAWDNKPSNATPTASLKAKLPEQPWNNSQFGLDYSNYYANTGNTATTIVGGSGGASSCATQDASGACKAGYAKPTWQTGAGVPADGVRDIPDLSLFASNFANFSIYPVCASDGDCQPPTAGNVVQYSGFGGTSVSTPAFAGMMALINQTYGRQGQANFVLYKLAAQFPASFNDVTVGSISVPCQFAAGAANTSNCIAVANPITLGTVVEGQLGTGTTPDYNATAGYDLATGLGTMDANVMYSNWNKVTGFNTVSVTLAASPATFVHGTNVTLSGTVTPLSAKGDVSLETTSTEPLQAAQTFFHLNNGAYTGMVNYLPGGTYTIIGAYGGDGTNGAATSAAVSVTVTPEPSTTILTPLSTLNYFGVSGGPAIASGATVEYGYQIELSGTPYSSVYYTTCLIATTPPASCTGNGTPTGSVTFTDSGKTLNVSPLNVQGDAEFNAPLEVGTHSLGASYSGDASYNASSSAALAVTVVKNTPDLLVSSAFTKTPAPGQAGTTALLINVENSANAMHTNQYGAAFLSPVAAPTGVVTITGLGSSTLTLPALAASVDSSVNAASGAATILIPASVPAGSYTLTVSYPGDAHYNAKTLTFSFTVAAGSGIPTTTTATASSSTTSPAAAVLVTATVTGTTAGGTPTGKLEIYASGVDLGAVTLPADTGASATATVRLNSASLLNGVNVVTLQYSGSTTYAPSIAIVSISNGTAGSQSIALAKSGDITIASPGGSGTSTITVTPSGGFTGAVTLSCAVTPTNLTATPTCSVGSVTIAGAAATATLTVNTTAASAALALPKLRLLPVGGGAGAALAALLFFAVPSKRRRIRNLLGALVLMVGIGMSAGCGSGSSTTTPGKSGTATGAYTVTVSATASGVSAPTPVAVTVTLQ